MVRREGEVTDKKILQELDRLKAEIAGLKEGKRGAARQAVFSKTSMLIGITASFVLSSIILYAAMIGKPHEFSEGDVISAGEMNDNFDSLFAETNLKETRIADLESAAGALDGRIDALENSSASQGGRITVLEGKDYENVPVRFIIAVCGVYPSRDEGCIEYDTQIVGEIRMFAGNFAPTGWMFCEGQLLQIAQNVALFSLLGTSYGGNGTTTFALPNLKGKVAVHPE
jgi:microcystin-dependent protein